MRSFLAFVTLTVLAGGCSEREPTLGESTAKRETAAEEAPPEIAAATPNTFLKGAKPTFVVATGGDEARDRAAAGQARFIAALFFPDAPVVTDAEIVEGKWPATPVVYGGPHDNAALGAIRDALPFAIDARSLLIGGQTFQGEGIQLVTVLPAREGNDRPHPEMLLYAGTGPDGLAEINALGKGNDPIVIGDAFGPLTRGRWVRKEEKVVAELGKTAPRIAWRDVSRTFARDRGTVVFRFPASLPPAPDEDVTIASGLRGLEQSFERLGLGEARPLAFHVYPDERSKVSLTGRGGHGHAVPAARALHVLKAPPAAIEGLVAHEATHVLARAWGPPGSALFGEGIAVWASGGYGGQRLDAWKGRVKRRAIEELLGRAFLSLPEAETYPLGGLLVDIAVAKVGLENVRDHLYPATAIAWKEACLAAGTSAEALQAELDRVTRE